MNLHEYQAKELFSNHAIAVPEGRIACSVAEAANIAQDIGGNRWVVKAQVHAGGRGKAGGVAIADSVDEVKAIANRLLGKQLVTHQTGAKGQPINELLIETATTIVRELYLSVVIDRHSKRIVFIASPSGGMDIEEVAAKQPEMLMTIAIDPIAGLQPYQCRKVGFFLQLEGQLLKELQQIMQSLCTLFISSDASQIEINPLVVTAEGHLLALDAKINLDDNALYRHAPLAQLRDHSQEDEREYRASQHGLNYVALEGEIGCMVNGAGLAMATMDLIQLHGGKPANFLDVGGGTTAERVAEAFKLILSDNQVKAILVNIFGGIVRCDLIAEGIIQAVTEVQPQVPIVVRLEGTNVELGRKLLAESGLAITAANDLNTAAQTVVAAAGGVA